MSPAVAKPRSAAARFLTGPWPAVALAVVCYASTAFNQFTYDDNAIVRDNPRIRSLTAFSDIWLRDWWYGDVDGDPIVDPARDRLYRPLTMCSFALNHAVNGARPMGFHVVNVLLHALACWLVWRFARRLCNDDAVASIAAVIFTVHPVHSEAVAGIVGRGEILAAVFLLLGLMALLPRHGLPSGRRGLLAALAFLAALLSKETAVCYPAVALIVLHFGRDLRRTTTRWRFTHGACLLAPLMVYFPLRYIALEDHLVRSKLAAAVFAPLQNANVLERITGAFTILGHYARLLVAPRNLSCDYGLGVFDPRNGPELMTLVGLLAAVVLIAALVGFWRREKTWRLCAALAAVFLASYALVSNTALLIGVSIAERLMYWPSVPVVIAAAALIVAGWRKHCGPTGSLRARAPLLRGLGAALLAAMSLRTVVRNSDWRDDERLFRADLATFPQSAHLNNSLAQVVIFQAQRAQAPEQRDALIAEAETLLLRAVEVHPRYADALSQLGTVRLLRNDRDRALQYFNSALLLDPSDKTARQQAAMLRDGAAHQRENARELLRRVEQDPGDAQLRARLVNVLISLGRNYEALQHGEEAARLAPNDADVLRAYGEALAVNRLRKEALEVLRRALRLNERDWRIHANISGLLAEDDPDGALRHAQIAFDLRPNDLRTHVNLAEALALAGRVDEALARLRRIERALPPDNPLRPTISDRISDLEHGRP